MEMDDSWYMDWYCTQASPEEKRLVKKVEEFGELFDDMLFQEGTRTYELIKCQTKENGSDEWIDDEMQLPDELSCFSYTFFHFKVEQLERGLGQYNRIDQTMTIIPEKLEDDSAILHEMIHIHEEVINELPMYYHDMIYWSLYIDLKNKIPKLDEILTGHAHLLTETSIYNWGGLHDILFMLKSFELDIRMRYPLGTVFAYGREKELKDYTYINDDIQ